MTLTRQTMPDEQRKSVILEYCKAFDKAAVTSDGGSVLDLSAEDRRSISPNAAGRRQGGDRLPVR
jgi:hypothetical protein